MAIPPPVRIKRVYAPPAESDGSRIFVDRLWPRGLGRDTAALTVDRRAKRTPLAG
ncbi:DUF488 family protein, N3 subclade [Sphingomonas bisphenolicum]